MQAAFGWDLDTYIFYGGYPGAAPLIDDPERWVRYVESAVGAHLVNGAATRRFELYYWRPRGKEVDFVLKRGDCVTAIEVKNGRRPTALPGMTPFTSMFKPRRTLLVGTGGLDLEEFLLIDPAAWVEKSS